MPDYLFSSSFWRPICPLQHNCPFWRFISISSFPSQIAGLLHTENGHVVPTGCLHHGFGCSQWNMQQWMECALVTLSSFLGTKRRSDVIKSYFFLSFFYFLLLVFSIILNLNTVKAILSSADWWVLTNAQTHLIAATVRIQKGPFAHMHTNTHNPYSVHL